MAGQYGHRAALHQLAGLKRDLHALQDLRRPHRLHQRVPGAHRAVRGPHQLLHRLIHPGDPARGVDGRHRILHGIEQRFQLAPALVRGLQPRPQPGSGCLQSDGDLRQLPHSLRGRRGRHALRQPIEATVQVIRLIGHGARDQHRHRDRHGQRAEQRHPGPPVPQQQQAQGPRARTGPQQRGKEQAGAAAHTLLYFPRGISTSPGHCGQACPTPPIPSPAVCQNGSPRRAASSKNAALRAPPRSFPVAGAHRHPRCAASRSVNRPTPRPAAGRG